MKIQTHASSATLLITTLLSLATQPASASDRRTLDLSILSRIQAVENGLDLVRVYPSRRLVINRSTPLGSDISVGDGVNVELNGKIRKDTLKKQAAGKILAVETLKSYGDYKGEYTRVYVSFDRGCTSTDCAFVFENPIKLDSSCNWSCSYWTERNRTDFELAGIPVSPQFTQVDSIWVGRKPIFWRGVETHKNVAGSPNVFDSYGKNLHLEVDIDELMKIEKESVSHDGW